MTHWFEYSIAGVHVLNAKRQVDQMKEVAPFYRDDFNYGEEERKIFTDNTANGVVVIYSINSAIESIVTLLSKELSIQAKNFYERVKKLKELKIITCHVEIEKLTYLRKKRNIITHWENNRVELLGSSDFLTIMFKNNSPENEFHELISLFTAEDLREYVDYLDLFIENIKENVAKKDLESLVYKLDCIHDGIIYWN